MYYVLSLAWLLELIPLLGLGLSLAGDYFLLLQTPFPIPQLMQRVRYQGDCQGMSAAIEWDPTAMMLGRWQLNPIPIIRQSGLPFMIRVTDSDWLVVLEKLSVQSSLPLSAWGLA